MTKISQMSSLNQRIISATILAPITLGILYIGGTIYSLFILLLWAIMLWEWCKMTRDSPRRWTWAIAGLCYITPACAVLIMLRHAAGGEYITINGKVLTFTLIALIWAIDIFAYFFGKHLKGPKIAPKISPNKTWAGLMGGIIGATAIATLYFTQTRETSLNIEQLFYLFLIGSITAIVAQTGDFFESWIKRTCNVKDSSTLIPGHGGLLDRLDGLLAVCWLILITLLIKAL